MEIALIANFIARLYSVFVNRILKCLR